MEIKIIESNTTYVRKSTDFTIELENGKTLSFSKWNICDDASDNYDCDYEFDEESQETYDNLSEEEQEDIDDFIGEIDL